MSLKALNLTNNGHMQYGIWHEKTWIAIVDNLPKCKVCGEGIQHEAWLIVRSKDNEKNWNCVKCVYEGSEDQTFCPLFEANIKSMRYFVSIELQKE